MLGEASLKNLNIVMETAGWRFSGTGVTFGGNNLDRGSYTEWVSEESDFGSPQVRIYESNGGLLFAVCGPHIPSSGVVSVVGNQTSLEVPDFYYFTTGLPTVAEIVGPLNTFMRHWLTTAATIRTFVEATTMRPPPSEPSDDVRGMVRWPSYKKELAKWKKERQEWMEIAHRLRPTVEAAFANYTVKMGAYWHFDPTEAVSGKAR